jgi:hypothetical protein
MFDQACSAESLLGELFSCMFPLYVSVVQEFGPNE